MQRTVFRKAQYLFASKIYRFEEGKTVTLAKRAEYEVFEISQTNIIGNQIFYIIFSHIIL